MYNTPETLLWSFSQVIAVVVQVMIHGMTAQFKCCMTKPRCYTEASSQPG